ncbi:MAG: glycosyltransferase [Chitinispirillaceae bacterium]|nr:glycosyltransferase [Chitinispirillaceae bacterium]
MALGPVEILLPTYNGGRYITGLLESLCNQTYSDFTLITRDDGSSDDTIDRMNSFSSHLKISRIENTDRTNLGAVKSFELLITRSSAELLFFCDQDDLWNPDKIERIVRLYEKKKAHSGSGSLLLFSDLSLVDENDTPAGDSFCEVNSVNTACIDDPYYLVFKNPSPGCAMAVSRSLATAALPFVQETFMHDWWVIIHAALTGEVVFLNDKLVRYRVHSGNTLGVTPDRQRSFLSLFTNWLRPSRLSGIVMLHRRHIKQGNAVFIRNGRKFSVFLYLVKVLLGRLIMPRIIRLTGRGLRYSWVSPPRR